MALWLRRGGLAALGIGLLTAALAGYRSYENRHLFGRWSWGFAGLLAALAGTALFLAVGAEVRRRRAAAGDPPNFPAAGLAIFLWGAAQLVAAGLDDTAMARLLSGGLCASTPPVPSLLEWVAIVLLGVALARRVGPRLWSVARGARGVRAAFVNGGLTVAAIAVGLILGEGLARLRVAIHPTVQGYPSLSTRAWKFRHAPLNAAGQRDRDHAPAAEPGRARLLVVGDSVAWGWGIESLDDRFGEQLARRLTEAGPRAWESITEARSDTHTIHHVDFLEDGLAYRPDLAILLYVFNDIDYLARVTPRRSPGSLNPVRLLIENSCLAQEVAVRAWLLARRAPGAADPYLDTDLVRRHLRDVRRFVATARRAGARPLVVPFDVRVSQTGAPRARYEAFVREAAALGLPVVALDAAFTSLSFEELTVNRLDHHPSARAHALAAGVVAARLQDGTR